MHTRRGFLTSTLAAGVALGLAACGDDTEEEIDAAPAQGEEPAASGDAPAPAPSGDTVTIGMKDIKFTVPNQEVKLGQTVRWVNEEDIAHNVVADSGASFKSGIYGKGKSYEYKPTKAGTIEYVCTLHPGMDGVLTVVA